MLHRVQELICGEQREAGRIPRTVECQLTSDLCDSCVPGDTVTVTGIVRVASDGMHSYMQTETCTWFLKAALVTIMLAFKRLSEQIAKTERAEAKSF
jgi:DNA helicase MCM8